MSMRTDSTWPETFALFGAANALSNVATCSTMLVRTVLATLAICGSVQSQDRTEIAEFAAHDASPYDRFGWSVASSGRTIVAGSPLDDDNMLDSGAAYVFVGTGGSWSEQAKLLAGDGTAFDEFGSAVDIDQDTIIVGAGNANSGGGAYVFERSGAIWTEVIRLAPSDLENGDRFGVSVFLQGDCLLIGSTQDDDANPTNPLAESGAAYVFLRSGTQWLQQAKLVASDKREGDYFGAAVALDGALAVVGAIQLDRRPPRPGAVYVFRRSGTTWSQEAKLTPSDGQDDDYFGKSVAVSGDTIAVGSCDDNVHPNGGAAYVFERVGSAWMERIKLVSPNVTHNGSFGSSVSLSGDTLAVGGSGESHFDPVTAFLYPGAGYVHVFERMGTAWSIRARLLASVPMSSTGVGTSVDVQGNRVVAGAALGDYGGQTDVGTTYVFDLSDPAAYCTGKTSSNGCVPFVTSTGTPSVSSGPFLVEGNDHLEGQAGLLLYSFKKSTLPFHGGTLCVKAPFRRLSTLVRTTDGVACSTCAGTCRTLERNFNQKIQSGQDPMLTAGQRVNLQWRQRDPLDPLGFGDTLSNALSFMIGS